MVKITFRDGYILEADTDEELIDKIIMESFNPEQTREQAIRGLRKRAYNLTGELIKVVTPTKTLEELQRIGEIRIERVG